MPEVQPFRGFRFDQQKVDSLDATITPPYDVITPEQRRTLAEASPYSMVHLMLPESRDGVDPYTVAGNLLREWLDEGILRRDADDSLYLFEQVFQGADGRQHVRRGFFALTKIPEPGERTILGHEHTFSNVVGDRRKLFESTNANLEPVFVLYADPNNTAARVLTQMDAAIPDLEAHSMDGVTQRLWRVTCPTNTLDFLKDKQLYIADGHHRFRTACEHRDLMRQRENPTSPQPYDYVMMGFVSMSDPGLLVYPTHRLLKAPDGFSLPQFLSSLEPWFECRPVDGGLAERVESEPGCAIGLALSGQTPYLLRLRENRRDELLADLAPSLRALDVEVLHKGILERIMGLPADTHMGYERDADLTLEAVNGGQYDMAFLLKACTTEQIRACAEAGQAMPHKSTYFFPKLPSGTVIYIHKR